MDDPLAVPIDALLRDPNVVDLEDVADAEDAEDVTDRLERIDRSRIWRGGFSDVCVAHLRHNTKSTLIQVSSSILFYITLAHYIKIQVCYKILHPGDDVSMPNVTRKANVTKRVIMVCLVCFLVACNLCCLFKRVRREMRAWKSLRHPNIIKFIGFAIESTSDHPTAALVSEWCKHGNVVQYLVQNPAAEREKLVSQYRSHLVCVLIV